MPARDCRAVPAPRIAGTGGSNSTVTWRSKSCPTSARKTAFSRRCTTPRRARRRGTAWRRSTRGVTSCRAQKFHPPVMQPSDTHGVGHRESVFPVVVYLAIDVALEMHGRAFAGPSSGEDAIDCKSPRSQGPYAAGVGDQISGGDPGIHCGCCTPSAPRWRWLWVPLPVFGSAGFPITRHDDQIRDRNSCLDRGSGIEGRPSPARKLLPSAGPASAHSDVQ